jgi:hypothetical protein
LNSGNGNSLTVKLKSAITNLNAPNTTAGVNQLSAFINQVNAFQQSGKLSADEAQALIAAANQAIASASGGGAHLMAQQSFDGTSTGDTQPVSSAGELLVGTVGVALENANGSPVPADEVARFEDAVNTLDTTFGTYGVDLVEVPSSEAIIRVDIAGIGAPDGVLGYTLAGQITLVTGWNWYTGADPASIGTDQYDFQTIVTHELGHAIGLGHSGDVNSVMYPYLAPGAVRRSVTARDLSVLDSNDDNVPEPLTAAPWKGRSAHLHQFADPNPARPTTGIVPAQAGAVTRAPSALGTVPLPDPVSSSKPSRPVHRTRISSRVTSTNHAARVAIRTTPKALEPRAIDALFSGALGSDGADRKVRFWDLGTEQESLKLSGDPRVTTIRLVSGDRRLIGSSTDRTVRVWDATPLPE